MGATATDHAAPSAYTAELTPSEAEAIFQRALRGQATPDDARRFTAHMLMEFARMSIEDGLVMQLHVGSVRNHNQLIFERFGLDKGCDIPQRSEFTHNLRAAAEQVRQRPAPDPDPVHPGRDRPTPASWRPWPATTRPSGWARPGGSTTASTA